MDITLRSKQRGAALRVRIPKAYLTDARTWSGGEQHWVEIQAGLPDLSPRPAVIAHTKGEFKARPELAKEAAEKNRNGVYVFLAATRSFSESSVFEPSSKYKSETSGKTAINPDRAGLRHFKRRQCIARAQVQRDLELEKGRRRAYLAGLLEKERGDPVCEYLPGDTLISPPDSDAGFRVFQCAGLDAPSRCRTSMPYKGWAIGYSIQATELHRRAEIEAHVARLLDGFVRDK